MRSLDEPIPEEEDLFRRIRADHVSGEIVLRTAVDLPRTSVNRSKYSNPRDALRASRPDFTGVASIRCGDLPPAWQSPSGDVPYEAYATDDPLADNEAHANLVLGRVTDGRRREGHKPASKAFRDKIAGDMARAMQIRVPPTHPTATC